VEGVVAGVQRREFVRALRNGLAVHVAKVQLAVHGPGNLLILGSDQAAPDDAPPQHRTDRYAGPAGPVVCRRVLLAYQAACRAAPACLPGVTSAGRCL